MLFRDEIGESLTLKFARAAAERRSKGLPVISLGLGEPDFDVPEAVIESAINVLRTTRSGYSDPMGLSVLREKLAFKLKDENSINCEPGNIIVTPGAKQAFQLVCMALLEPGDEAIVINPSFVSFIPQIYIAEPSCKIITVDIKKTDFSLSPGAIEENLSLKTKMVVINSPNNPAGYVFDELFITELYRLAQKKGFWIISDEVYEKLNFSGRKNLSIGSLEAMPERVVTINGFSKSHAMTGWRLGYACFPKKLHSKLLKLQQHINTNTCTFIQLAVAQAFGTKADYLTDYNTKLAKRAGRVVKLISSLDKVSIVPPDAGFFAFMNIADTDLDSNTFCSRLIEETGVATTPGIAFGTSWDDHVRISYATKDDILDEGMNLMCDFIKSL